MTVQNKKRIPADDKVPYQRWVMPDLTGVRRRIAQRLDELQADEANALAASDALPEPPVPEELQALRDEVRRQQGYAEGFEQGRQQGHEEGRATGYQEGEEQGQDAGFQAGYQRGLEQSRHEVDQQLARLQGLIEQLQGPLAQLDQEVESALLSLVDLVCRSILRREISLDHTFLPEVLTEAVAALPAGHQRLRIFLNPDDLALVEAACENLLEDYRLIGDPQITPGGVRIETLQSLVDSTLEKRYKKIIDQLLGDRYQVSAADSKPLPRDVLATPDSPPLESLSFSEAPATPAANQSAPPPPEAWPAEEVAEHAPEAPSAPSSPSDAPATPVSSPVAASSSLSRAGPQRSGVPRNLAPVSSTERGVQQKSETAEPLTEADEDEFFEQAFDALLQQETPPAQANKPEAEETDAAEAVAEKKAAATAAEEIELDRFLEGYSETPASVHKARSDEGSVADEGTVVDEGAAVGEGSAVADETDRSWAPDSVHDAHYDVFADTWMDDLSEAQGKAENGTDQRSKSDDQH